MQADDSTLAAPTAAPRRRVLVLVGGPFPGHDDYRAGLIAARAQAADVRIVAPALPVPGERWIIDVGARRARARAHVQSWIDALANRARCVHGEVGDESPRLALADALAGFAADEYLDALVPAGASPASPGPLERLHDRLTRAPASTGLGTAHA